MAKPKDSSPDRSSALAQIRTAMVEKKLTQAALAELSDCHEKTVQNLMRGRPVRDQTLFDVAMVLGLDYEVLKGAWGGGEDASVGPMDLKGEGGLVAPVYMGAYTRAAVDHYIGSYLTLRPAFTVPGTLVAYRTDVVWDPEWPSLLFEERDRPDGAYAHRGRLYVPASASFIHLVSLTKGAMRMIVVSQIDQGGVMRGLITTLNKHRASFTPVSAPIVYVKRDTLPTEDLGEIGAAHPRCAEYRQLIEDAVGQGYVRLVGL
jgi:hypothetical protein